MQAHRLALILIILLIVPSVIAVWDPETIKFSEGMSESVGPYLVKLDEIDLTSKSAFVTVSQGGRTLSSGPIGVNRPFVLANKIRIDLQGFAKQYSYGMIANTETSLWVDGRIATWRFPKTMTTLSNVMYNAYIVVENTGAKDATFKTEIVQEGIYVPYKDRYQLEDGTEVSRLLDVTQPIHFVNVPIGDAVREDYKEIAGNQRQHRGPTDLNREGGIYLNLYYKGQLLDSVTVPFSLSTLKSGAIQDILVPDTMSSDNAYESVASLLNAGLNDGNSEGSKLNLELRTKGFVLQNTKMEGYGSGMRNAIADVVSPTTVRGTVINGEVQPWRFTITPHVLPGRYVLTFVLTGRSGGSGSNGELDRVEIPVRVQKGFLTRIEGVSLPEDVSYGDQLPIRVTLNNVGVGREVLLTLTSPVLETPIKKQLKLPGYQKTDVDFMANALSTGDIPFVASLYTQYTLGDHLDPTGGDKYLLDTAKFTIPVIAPYSEKEEQETPVEKPTTPAVKEEATPPLAPAVVAPTEYVPPVETTQPEVTQQIQPAQAKPAYMDYLPWILVAIAVLLVILGIKIIWDAYHVDEIEEELVPIQPIKIRKKQKR